MSALGQKQTFAVQNSHVRFAPKSGHVQCNSVCPLCAKSGLMHRSKRHPIRSPRRRGSDSGLRDGDAERLGGLEVDDTVRLSLTCCTGRSAGFLRRWRILGRHRRQTCRYASVTTGSIANQTARRDELAISNRNHRIADCQCSQLFNLAIEEHIGAYDERTGAHLAKAREGVINLRLRARVEHIELEPQGYCCRL